MSGNTARRAAITAATNYTHQGAPLDYKGTSAAELFGSNVFGLATMKAQLPKEVFRSLKRTMDTGAPLDPKVADVVAATMKAWALGKGATHYAHVFYPLTGLSAAKHDSFLSPDGEGGAITEFTGKTLLQGEPDASSFPNGGIRGTAEARGYTAWDVTSLAYLIESPSGMTLCIPTAFISWSGEALDKKTPLLRSGVALNAQAARILKLFGHDKPATIVSYAGAEQEYFLIDKHFFYTRPDLISAGRTLFGAKPPKGQEFEDQYFGVIPERVIAYMMDVERECFKLGVPVKTRHNEVAPGQYEVAPVFEAANIAADHQQMIMTMLKQVAEKHGLVCLLHEKPFAGVNGSGKHVNFSFGNSTQGNLLEPGETPHDNAQFLVFCGAVIATASNDHRLGANEAPPAIISVFLGEQLSDVFEQIRAGGAKSSKLGGTLEIGVDSLPKLVRDAGDRNRTSPFAFTGNKFEFRAVGSSQSIADPLIALNTAVAESCDYIATKLEAGLASGKKLNVAIQELLGEIIRDHGAVVFDGNGYSAEWHAEAEKRALPNYKTAVDALPVFQHKDVIGLFEKYKVLTPRELAGRYEVYVEQYNKSVNVEAKLTAKIAKTSILPAALHYQTALAENAIDTKAAGITSDTTILKQVSELIGKLQGGILALEAVSSKHVTEGALAEAKHFCTAVIPAMAKVREVVDTLETIVDDELWPLPTFQEILFIK